MDQEINALLEPNKGTVTLLRGMSMAGSILVVILGIISLISWKLNIPLTTAFFSNVIDMSSVAAFAYICSGISLFIQLRHPPKSIIPLFSGISIIFSSIPIVIGLTAITSVFRDSNIFGNSLTFDMGLSFLFLGTALVLLEIPRKKMYVRVAQILTLLAAIISMFVIIGYAYHTVAFYTTIFSPMPLSSALTSTLLCLSILFAESNHGLTKVLTRNTPSSVLAFRLILITLTLPAILGFLSLMYQQTGFYDMQTGIVLLVIGNIIMITTIIWLNSSIVQKLELENLIIRREVEKKNVTLEVNAKDLAAKMLALEEQNQRVYEKLLNREKLFEVTDNTE